MVLFLEGAWRSIIELMKVTVFDNESTKLSLHSDDKNYEGSEMLSYL